MVVLNGALHVTESVTVTDQSLGLVLLLNSTYEPLSVVCWKKAMTLLFLGKVEVLEEQDRFIHSANYKIALPSVMRLFQRVSVPQKRINFSRTNIFTRDDFTCQYCGKVLPRKKLTLDHVVPKSRGGATDWSNMVTCCVPCNRKKGDLTPTEANMPLLKQPCEPKWSPVRIHQKGGDQLPEPWEQYVWF